MFENRFVYAMMLVCTFPRYSVLVEGVYLAQSIMKYDTRIF